MVNEVSGERRKEGKGTVVNEVSWGKEERGEGDGGE